MLRQPVAIVSCLALAAASVTVVRRHGQERWFGTFLLAGLFFVAAGTTRYWLQDTRSRWQIITFVAVAMLIALARHRRAGAPALVNWLVWVGAAAAGVILVRWRTEGSPF